MLNDPAGTVRELPSTRAYERADIERLVADAERLQARLELRLEAARRRRIVAEARMADGPSRDDHDRAVALAHAALDERQRDHDAAIAELHRTSTSAAAQLLRAAEQDATDRERQLFQVLGLEERPDRVALRPQEVTAPLPVSSPASVGSAAAPVLRPARVPSVRGRRPRDESPYARSVRLRREQLGALARRSGR